MTQRLAGGLLVVVLALWLVLVEVFWLPLRVFGVPVPVSVVAAVAGNLLLVALAARLTGSRLAAVLPALVWLVVAVGASLRRPEGDLLLVGGGVLGMLSLAFLLAGVVAAAFAVGRVLAAPPRGADRPTAPSPS
ncbi:MAG: hypothetical protein M3Q47_09355 [Actinomycetota bacterium]|nr:hypothetical protein [Actinomycetota bacterium]